MKKIGIVGSRTRDTSFAFDLIKKKFMWSKDKIEYYFVLKNNIEKINIITNLKEFFKQKPPCSNCLVQNMCVIEYKLSIDELIYLNILVCDKLRKFVDYNKLFFIDLDYKMEG